MLLLSCLFIVALNFFKQCHCQGCNSIWTFKDVDVDETTFRAVEEAARRIAANQSEIALLLRQGNVLDETSMQEYYRSIAIPLDIIKEINSYAVSERAKAILDFLFKIKPNEVAKYTNWPRLNCKGTNDRIASSDNDCDFNGNDKCSYGLQGKCLSPFQPGSGSFFQPFEYLTQPYCTLDSKPTPCSLPSARIVSNNLVNRTNGVNLPSRAANVFALAIAEFVSFDSAQTVYDTIHDGGLALSECSADQKTIYASYLQTPKTSRIKINCFDSYNTVNVTCLNFVRTQKVQKECNLEQGATLNRATPVLDLHHLYSSENQQDFLGRFDGKFPRDSDGIPILSDKRAIQHSSLQIVYLFYANLHDKILDALKLTCPGLSPSQLYFRTKQLVTYLYQKLWYDDFLEIFIGATAVTNRGLRTNIPTLNVSQKPSVFSDFACGAAHGLHKFVPDQIFLADSSYKSGTFIPFRTTYYNDSLVKGKTLELIRGNLATPFKTNGYSTEITRNLFFKSSNGYGADLLASSINRGRDCCLSPYIYYLKLFFNACVSTLTDLAKHISTTNISQLYASVQDVELAYAGPLEPVVSGACLGKTFSEIIIRQYRALKDGDPKFITHKLSAAQLDQIRKLTFGNLLCVAFDLQQVPKDARYPVNDTTNPLVPCESASILNYLSLSTFCSSNDCV